MKYFIAATLMVVTVLGNEFECEIGKLFYSDFYNQCMDCATATTEDECNDNCEGWTLTSDGCVPCSTMAGEADCAGTCAKWGYRYDLAAMDCKYCPEACDFCEEQSGTCIICGSG